MKSPKIYAKVKITDDIFCLVYLSRRARCARISVSPENGARLTIPDRAINKDRLIMKLLWERKAWILKMINKLEKAPNLLKLPPLTEPQKREAKSAIIKRTGELADEFNLKFNQIYLKNQKTRWGSCSSRGNLSFNFKLMLISEDLRDYVILHELVHLKHPNHSRAFWNELNKICPQSEKYKKILKNIR